MTASLSRLDDGRSQSLFDCLGLAQRVGAQSGKDVIYQRGVVAAATAMQQSGHASAGQGRGFGRGRAAWSTSRAVLCFRFGKVVTAWG